MKNIVIVGNGGVGSNLSLPLLKLIKYQKDIGKYGKNVRIKIIDGDTVESKNVIRQQFLLRDEGEFKSDITANYLNQMCGELREKDIAVESYPFYLKDNNASIIEEDDTVFVGVDNKVSKMVVENRALQLKNCIVIFGANEYDDGDVNVFIREKGKNLTPLYSKKHPEIKEKDKFPDELSCEEASKSSPQLVLVNMMVAQYMLEAFYSCLGHSLKWHEKFFDIRTGAMRAIG